MKTDSEKLITLLSEFGVGFEFDKSENSWSVSMEACANEKVDGYIGFTCCFLFDTDGKFVSVEIAE